MNIFIVGKLLLALGVLAIAAASSSAAIVWDLNPNNLDQNAGTPTVSFNSSGYTITATGYDHATSGADPFHLLYFKSEPQVAGANERGLG
ncbi:MAG: hypothetical protein M3032_08670, partial [Verrucomicrobiota bacterium]|nr:hypothetical protein [Verrucomicrobiota bacterium]